MNIIKTLGDFKKALRPYSDDLPFTVGISSYLSAVVNNDMQMWEVTDTTISDTNFFRLALGSLTTTITTDQIVNIANEVHRAMPADADEQAEMLAIVKEVLAEIGIKL